DAEVLEQLYQHLRLPIAARVTGEFDVEYSVRANGHGQAAPSWELFKGNELLSSTSDVTSAFRDLESDMHLEVALHARTGLFVHAGVVAWNGQAILIPGRSFAGKSTLVAALVRSGAIYYSDEYAVIDSRGRVHPYLKPISLRNPDGTTRKMNVAELGGQAGSEPIPVHTVVFAKHRKTATWQPRRISESRTLLQLMDNTVVAQLKPQLALQRLALVASRALGWKGLRGEADEAAAWLLDHMDSNGKSFQPSESVEAVS
ncbi:MAG: hypothetical protein JO051_05910, partial [Acidobacteriaceae bacterium]|nr:hypothetical protein [Acidobacteriaceae bacterium]